MRRAVAALALGLLLLVVAFGIGTTPRTAQAAGVRVDCGAAVPSSWLVPGTPASSVPREARAACARSVTAARWSAYAVGGVGALLALVGWTAVRETGTTQRRRPGTAYAAG